jgi:hypothetical protein
VIWFEEHLGCRPGWSGRPLMADRLRVWGRRNQPRVRMVLGGVIQRRPMPWMARRPDGAYLPVWRYEGTAAEVIRALMPEPRHQESRRQT